MANSYEAAFHRQGAYFVEGKTRPLKARLDALKRLKAALDVYEDRLCGALYEDLRKSRFEAYATEIGILRHEIKRHLKRLPRWIKEKRVRSPIFNFKANGQIRREPYGRVLVMAPWNYPFQLLFVPLVGAISGGNCVTLKPSPYTPQTAEVMARLIQETFDPGFVNLFQGHREVNQALFNLPYDLVFFTGSPNTGKAVMAAAAKNLTPVVLELGGKNPCVVHDDADIAVAAARIMWGKCLNAGQTCLAPDYLLVQRAVKEDCLAGLRRAVSRFFGENPRRSADFPRIVNEKQFDRVVGLMAAGKAVCGGEHDRDDLYIAPTVLDHISGDEPIMREEIFGPVLPVITYDSLEEAAAFMRARPKPLAAYFFSRSRRTQRYLLDRAPSGGGCINDTIMHFTNPNLPFGGVGYSGMGSYHGRFSFETFTQPRSIERKANWPDLALRYPPYTDKKARMLRWFLH